MPPRTGQVVDGLFFVIGDLVGFVVETHSLCFYLYFLYVAPVSLVSLSSAKSLVSLMLWIEIVRARFWRLSEVDAVI